MDISEAYDDVDTGAELYSLSTPPSSPRNCLYFADGRCPLGRLCRFSRGAIYNETSTAFAPASHVDYAMSMAMVNPLSRKNSRNSIATPTTESFTSASELVVPNTIQPGLKLPTFDPISLQSANASSSTTWPDNAPYNQHVRNASGIPDDVVNGNVLEQPSVNALGLYDVDQWGNDQTEDQQQEERKKEVLLAIARSRNKTCGICFEVVMEKSWGEDKFGILPNCSHVFCLQCIRKWRKSRQFDSKVVRACPECRIISSFICPSAFWVEGKDDKEKLLVGYKAALGLKDCKYFKKGDGECPFGNKCFYKHALPNGDIVDVGGPPHSQRRQRIMAEIVDILNVLDFGSQDFNWLDGDSAETDEGYSGWDADLFSSLIDLF